jgi:hypothetical protein
MLKLLYLFVPMKVSEARSLDRDVVETGLAFAGFAVSNKSFTHDATPPTPAKKKKETLSGFCNLLVSNYFPYSCHY